MSAILNRIVAKKFSGRGVPAENECQRSSSRERADRHRTGVNQRSSVRLEKLPHRLLVALRPLTGRSVRLGPFADGLVMQKWSGCPDAHERHRSIATIALDDAVLVDLRGELRPDLALFPVGG